MAGTDTVEVYKGEDALLLFAMLPVEDITGWTIALTVRGASGVLITKSADIESAEDGTFSFTLDSDDTAELRAGTYAYDVWRTDDGSEHVIAIGEFSLLPIVRDLL